MSKSPPPSSSLPCLLLALLVLAAYLPTLRNGFVNYDDPGYVTSNREVERGVTAEGIVWAFGATRAANWHPITWLSHMIDCELYGVQPMGHHLTSMLFQMANSALLFVLFVRMTSSRWRSFFLAAFFGLHPMHVESVAWISERKDVLSGFFFLLTLLAYGKAVSEEVARDGTRWLYLTLAILLYALGLMSKPMLVTLPFLLLLLDYWPLGRFGAGGRGFAKGKPLRLALEKTPFLALAILSSIITITVQKSGGAVENRVKFPLAFRFENAAISYWRYIGKLFWPANLAFFYPSPHAWPRAAVGAAALGLLAVSIAVTLAGKGHPELPVGWFWFLGMLLPVIGLVQVGGQSMADRYSYLPSIGILVMVIWGVCELTARGRALRIGMAALAGLALLCCAGLTRRQTGFWADSETLTRHAIAVTEGNWMAHERLGNAIYNEPGRQQEAISEYREALRLRPEFVEARAELGMALTLAKGRPPDATPQNRAAEKNGPNDAATHNNLGNLLVRTPGRLLDGIAEYEAAVRANPEMAEAQFNLGLALLHVPSRAGEALSHFEAAARAKPDFTAAREMIARLKGAGTGVPTN